MTRTNKSLRLNNGVIGIDKWKDNLISTKKSEDDR
jgi:hypothetical protein